MKKVERIAKLRLRRLVVIAQLMYYEDHSENDSYTRSPEENAKMEALQNEWELIDVELGYLQGIKIHG